MNWFVNLSVGRKLWVSNSLLCVLMVIIVGVLLQRLHTMETNVLDVDKMFRAADLLLQSDRDLFQALVAERSLLYTDVKSEKFRLNAALHETKIREANEKVDASFLLFNDKYSELLYGDYKRIREDWLALTETIRVEREQDTRHSRRTAMEVSFGSSAQAFDAMRAKIKEMVEHARIAASQASLNSSVSVHQSFITTLTLSVFFLFAFVAITILLPKMIVKPMHELYDRINNLAGGGGDLTQKIEVHSEDEIGQLGHAVNRFVESLRLLLGQIISLGNQFADQASSLEALSKRNKQVTDGAMEETDMLATSITQMSASVHEVASSASGAASQAQVANDESQSGKKVVESTKQVISTLSEEVQVAAKVIERLKNDASSIDDVVNVIRGIAEQTNLLALNAAIEAARAGEQGRGFAVVADEVRALASRTQSSTEEIQEMICALQESADDAFTTMQKGKVRAETAESHSNQAKTSLDKITNAIAEMADMNTQIAAAAEEQSMVSSEISENANKLSLFSREAAELSDGVSASTLSLSKMAALLKKQLANFKV